MHFDPWILAFSAATVIATIWMGFWSAKRSKTAHDFFVAGRSISVGWNASAISGEYLSAASFMGVAGMVMSSGYDALWYPVCYACGYLFLLLFIAGPLRRFGAYTIPDFAEGRFDSPLFRKIAVVFVLFIGFFYTMPQMKGAGTTLAYIFPGMPYWGGVVLVGAVITLNVALGGMKGITLVQAFQYWAKMFAISVPIFVLMTVYGHYGQQLSENSEFASETNAPTFTLLRYTRPEPEMNWKRHPAWLIGFYERQQRKNGVEEHFGNVENFLNQIGAQKLGIWVESSISNQFDQSFRKLQFHTTAYRSDYLKIVDSCFNTNGLALLYPKEGGLVGVPTNRVVEFRQVIQERGLACLTRHKEIPAKAPADSTWLNPFGPLTTKAAKAAAAALTNRMAAPSIPLRADLLPTDHITVTLGGLTVTQALVIYADITGRQLLPRTHGIAERLDDALNGRLRQLNLVKRPPEPDSGVRVHGDGYFTPVEVKETVETFFKTNGLALAPEGERHFRVVNRSETETAAAKTSPQAWMAVHERPLALLYTYSLIIALVCGTAGLPHILVRFYTNPDGTAAKRTTMWVMILIGVFYLFPPIFGVIGRNLLPELYAGIGAKGTDKIVLELPRILNERYGALGSILSGITCAGAFAAFMSTFSGLLVSMTGALAHDVYGRMLNPKSTPRQRLRAFRITAVIVGGVAILIGTQVEPLQINFMVGQAFAIAAASYFPLLFMSVWWRKLTMKGAASGMLAGGLCAVAAISLTSFSDLAIAGGQTARVFAAFKPLNDFWAAHPLLRILCEQPALWTVPLAIGLMVVVSKLTAAGVPSDIRLKMLVLHAPEQLGLKQEYIQEHQVH